jgi:hypothetical protein
MRFFILIISLFFYSVSAFSFTTVAECDTLLPEITFESNDFSVTIHVDLLGRVVYSTESISNKVSLKLDQFKAGSYILKVISEKEKLKKSVILN